MIQNHATLSEIRHFLKKELAAVYSAGETSSLFNMIMEHLGYPFPETTLNPDFQPGPEITAQIKEIVPDIHKSRPIQYILGEITFLDLQLQINENALIPRPETEEMVHRIIMENRNKPQRILDLCSGSGCIALTLKNKFPEAMVTGVEKSPGALDLARQNSKKNQLSVNWIEADLLRPEKIHLGEKFDLIVSNPPYVMECEKAEMEKNVLDFEPHDALFVEDHDPLVFYKIIGRLSADILASKGVLWLEINEKFGCQVKETLEESGFTQIKILKDIHEKERFIEARK